MNWQIERAEWIFMKNGEIVHRQACTGDEADVIGMRLRCTGWTVASNEAAYRR